MESKKQIKMIDLGWSFARLTARSDIKSAVLTVTSPSTSDQDGYQPAESVTIVGEDALRNLHQALSDALAPPTSPPSTERSQYALTGCHTKAKVAEKTLWFYRQQSGNMQTSDHEAITDLATDLLHYLNRHFSNPTSELREALNVAHEHFIAEKENI